MQSNSVSNISFTSVIPVRVFNGTEEVLDARIVHKACREAVKALSGPLADNPQFRPAAAQLAVKDSDYSYQRAFYGYKEILPDSRFVPSRFFKIIQDKFNRGYIVTGAPSDLLSQLGHEIGKAQRACKKANLTTSPKLEDVKKKYWQTYTDIGNNMKLRIRDLFDTCTREKLGRFQKMNLHITTKPVKIKGEQDTKVNLQDITFSDFGY